MWMPTIPFLHVETMTLVTSAFDIGVSRLEEFDFDLKLAVIIRFTRDCFPIARAVERDLDSHKSL